MGNEDAQSYKTVEVGQKIPLTPRSQISVPSEQNDIKRATSGMLKTPWEAASQQAISQKVKPGDHKLTEVVIDEHEAKKDKDKQLAEADIAQQPE